MLGNTGLSLSLANVKLVPEFTAPRLSLLTFATIGAYLPYVITNLYILQTRG